MSRELCLCQPIYICHGSCACLHMSRELCLRTACMSLELCLPTYVMRAVPPYSLHMSWLLCPPTYVMRAVERCNYDRKHQASTAGNLMKRVLNSVPRERCRTRSSSQPWHTVPTRMHHRFPCTQTTSSASSLLIPTTLHFGP